MYICIHTYIHIYISTHTHTHGGLRVNLFFPRMLRSASAYDTLIRAHCRAALARSRPAPARAAHALLRSMGACGLAPSAAARSAV